jgi:hypothetical protein
MARIETYPLDTAISVNDYVIGTDGDSLNATKNYKVLTFLDYLGTQYNLNSTDLLFNYNDVVSTAVGDGEVSTNNYADGTILMSGVTNIYVSKLTAFGQLVDDIINTIGTNTLSIMFADMGNRNNLGLFNVVSTADVDANTINITVTVTTSSGSLTAGKVMGVRIVGEGGGGAVDSVFGRTGAVTAEVGDYSAFYGQLGATNTWTGTNNFEGFTIFKNIVQINHPSNDDLNIISFLPITTMPTGTDSGGAATELKAGTGGELVWESITGNGATIIDPSNLTVARTFALPDSDGTIALTSDLGNYVDKTSTETVGGLKSFSSSIHAQAGRIIFNDDTATIGYASGGSMGYLGLSQYYFHQDHVTVAQAAGILDFDSLTVDRIFTFPDTAGTVALEGSFVELTGNQSVGGAKTFTSSCVFDATIRMPISIKGGGVTGVGGLGYIATDQYIFYKDAEGRGMIFDFSLVSSGAIDRTYTFQNANGTLAFTSDIPTISDVAYDATTWNANTDGASKNAIRDKLVTIEASIGETLSVATGTFTDPDFTGADPEITLVAAQGAGKIILVKEFVVTASNYTCTTEAIDVSFEYGSTNGFRGMTAPQATNGDWIGAASLGLNEPVSVVNQSVTVKLWRALSTSETTTGDWGIQIRYEVLDFPIA